MAREHLPRGVPGQERGQFPCQGRVLRSLEDDARLLDAGIGGRRHEPGPSLDGEGGDPASESGRKAACTFPDWANWAAWVTFWPMTIRAFTLS